MQLLVRVERPATEPVCSAIVLDLVISDAVAAGWNFLQRIFVAPYATGTLLGDADLRCAATFRILALGLLGMDGRGGSVRISLRRAAIRDVESELAAMKAEHDPLASHIFVSRRHYRNDNDMKSGKRREMNARPSFNSACKLGFRGSLDEWERLRGAVAKR